MAQTWSEASCGDGYLPVHQNRVDDVAEAKGRIAILTKGRTWVTLSILQEESYLTLSAGSQVEDIALVAALTYLTRHTLLVSKHI